MATAVIAEVFADALDASQRALELITAAHPRHIALSGGSSPKRLYQMMGAEGTLTHADVWFADERCVPPSSPDSNYGLVVQTLGQHSARAIHRVLGEDPPDEAAAAYDEEILEELGAEPVFDLIVLGMGPDGHCASLFPGAPELGERSRVAIATREQHSGHRRVTLTLPVLNRAREAVFLVTGSDKAQAYHRILAGEDLPAARVLGARWLVDEAVAMPPPPPPPRRNRRAPSEGQESLFN